MARRVGQNKGADGKAGTQQAGRLGPQGGDIVIAQGGRVAQHIGRHAGAVDIAFDGGAERARRLRRFADNVVALAPVALRGQQREDDRCRHGPGQHEPRDSCAYRRQIVQAANSQKDARNKTMLVEIDTHDKHSFCRAKNVHSLHFQVIPIC